MPYIVTRADKDLGLKLGQELQHEEGKLPIALKFVAKWVEPEKEKPAEKQKGKASK